MVVLGRVFGFEERTLELVRVGLVVVERVVDLLGLVVDLLGLAVDLLGLVVDLESEPVTLLLVAVLKTLRLLRLEFLYLDLLCPLMYEYERPL